MPRDIEVEADEDFSSKNVQSNGREYQRAHAESTEEEYYRV
jgi:hypothetical protein